MLANRGLEFRSECTIERVDQRPAAETRSDLFCGEVQHPRDL
jgi:hypothetical protein